MELATYLSKKGTQTSLAKAVGASAAFVNQWKAGRRPVPVSYCAAIERATGGAVTRKDLRPDDYGDIWPELVDTKGASAAPEKGAVDA